jgi:hypothetical protein
VVVQHIFMVVRCCHECGRKEKQNKKSSSTFVPIHNIPFTPVHRLIPVNEFVKQLLNIIDPCDFRCENNFGMSMIYWAQSSGMLNIYNDGYNVKSTRSKSGNSCGLQEEVREFTYIAHITQFI